MNKHGLSRDIPVAVKREVRQRCKFACVICRRGIYQYEHIDPFAEVAIHDPDRICCLCGSCHDLVTRGQLSKAAVNEAYDRIRAADPSDVAPPTGPLDFHTGHAQLSIGGLRYSPAVTRVLRCRGTDIITVTPGEQGIPGSITATFHDESGAPVFQIVENEWLAAPINWDVEVVGARMVVRNPARRIVLSLRLEPPGVVVVERLDMRIDDTHVLVSEDAYALGRYVDDGSLVWVSADLTINRAVQDAVGLESLDPGEASQRVARWGGVGPALMIGDGSFIVGSPIGVLCPPLGISIAFGCSFQFYGGAYGVLDLVDARRAIQQGRGPLWSAISNRAV